MEGHNHSVVTHPQQHQSAQAATSSASGAPAAANGARYSKPYESVTICLAKHCPAALQRDQWNVSDFELRKCMYNGTISMVYHAVDKRSGITIALKLYKRVKLNEIERHQVAREIRLHSELAHDSIIALYAAWKDRCYVYLALEWAPGGDVYSYLKSHNGHLSEEVAVPLILEPFMAGLAIIHAKGLIHRDIKPENILLNNSFQIKIADFGLSIDSKSEIANTRLGTIDYLAPEILNCPVKQHPHDHKDQPQTGYTNRVDCWSVGVLAYELLTGSPPFASASAHETLQLIRSKHVEYPAYLSPEAVNFMKSVLVRDPGLRPGIADLLMHPWILKYSRREGVARGNARYAMRSPTVDGGSALSRSVTADFSSLGRKAPPPLMVPSSVTTAAQSSPIGSAPAGDPSSMAAAAAAATACSLKHLHLSAVSGQSSPLGGSSGHAVQSTPLPKLAYMQAPAAHHTQQQHVHAHAAAAIHFAGSGSAQAQAAFLHQQAQHASPSGPQDEAMSMFDNGFIAAAAAPSWPAQVQYATPNGPGQAYHHSQPGTGSGMYAMPLPAVPRPMTAAPGAAAASAAPPLVAAPTKTKGVSITRKLKFWSTASSSPSSPVAGQYQLSPFAPSPAVPPVDGDVEMRGTSPGGRAGAGTPTLPAVPASPSKPKTSLLSWFA